MIDVDYNQLKQNSIPSIILELDTIPNYETYLEQTSNLLNIPTTWQRFNELVNNTYEYFLTPYGLETVKDRFLLRDKNNQIIETPKYMIARVASSLANTEVEAIEFFTAIYNRKFMPSSPILFNAGTKTPQLSSCYIHTVDDSLDGIFKSYQDMAKMAKFSGGISTDWTNIRSIGSSIKGTLRTGQGLIPWLKIQDDISLAVNQGGRRKGAHCAYLEVWHKEIFEFCSIRKPIGDESRLTHQLHTAIWIPDLFMKRVKEDGYWTLFCPADVPDLHYKWGLDFEAAYKTYETMIKGQQIKAKDLWKHILTSLFETGHPWITFKDNINKQSNFEEPILASNLCTEITLPTDINNTAVCTLSSINLAAHEHPNDVVRTAYLTTKFLNRIIDKSWYPTPEAKMHAQRYRPLGVGVMGYQDKLQQSGIVWGSKEHEQFDALWFHNIYQGCRLANQSNKVFTAIAPTATISYIVGVSPSIEPYIANIYTIEGLSGRFTMLANPQWLNSNPLNPETQNNPLFKTAFELDQKLLIEAAARRQKFICQSQSLNLYVEKKSGKMLSDLYFHAWELGIKTTYYLRTKAASARGIVDIDKNTLCNINNEDDCQACQ